MNKISITLLLNIFFVIYVVFFMSTLKFTLGLTALSTGFNIFLFVIAVICILYGLAFSRFDLRSTIFLVVAFCIVFSCLLNLLMHWSYLGLITVAAYLLTWLALVMVIVNKELFLHDSMRYWRWFNLFVVTTCFIGLCEYSAVYIFGYRPPIMELSVGTHWVGYSTLFHWVEGLDIPYFRFMGTFGEPGNLAMWAALLLVYNLFRRQYAFGFVLFIALIATYSPSSIISLSIALVIYVRSRSAFFGSLMLLATCVTIGIFVFEIAELYSAIMEMKITSLGNRANANTDFIEKLPFLIQNHPFGIDFFETTALKVESGVGFEVGYGPIYSYEIGGLIAFLGYLFFTLYSIFISIFKVVSLKTSLVKNELYIYCLMITPYLVQRQSLFDYAISALLFAGFFIPVRKYDSTDNYTRVSQ